MFGKVFSRIANLRRDSSQYEFMADHQNVKFNLQSIKELVSGEANNFSKMHLKSHFHCSQGSVLGINVQSLKAWL
jgi:hypothetical protein